MTQPSSPSRSIPRHARYVVGIDIGSQSCSFCALKPDKRSVIKPTDFANTAAGFAVLLENLQQLGASPSQILVGLEATSRDAGQSVSSAVEARLRVMPAPSQTNPSIRTTTRLAGENGQVRCQHDSACPSQRGSPSRLRPH